MDKGLMQNKTFLKIISLVIAVILWMYVIATQDPESTNRIENVQIVCGLSQHQLNEGLTIISKSDENVSFTATGKRSLVTGVKGSYYANLDLNDIEQPGRYNVSPQISKPGGVYIENIHPASVEVYVDKYVSTLVPMNIKTENTLPDDYIIKSITPSIEQAAVTAPSLELEQVAYAGITVDLSKIKKSETLECTPEIYDKDGNVVEIDGMHIDTKTVKVSVDILKVKKVKVVPALSKELKDYTISATPEYVKISGEIDALKDINVISTAVVDVSGIKSKNEFKTQLLVPTGTKLLDEKDSDITVVIRKEE